MMSNHYHVVLHTRQANLSLLMRHINGVYTQISNRRHGKVGHLFQGRFKAILVDREAHLLEVCRFVKLNPVRAHIVTHPSEWPWSSYRAHVNQAVPPPWLDTAGLQAYVLGHKARTDAQCTRAAAQYASLVAEGRDVALGRTQRTEQRRIRRSLDQWLNTSAKREQALWQAYTRSGIRMTEIARLMGLSASRASRLIGAEEARQKVAHPHAT